MISKISYQKYFKKEIDSKYIYIQFAIFIGFLELLKFPKKLNIEFSSNLASKELDEEYI